MTHLGKKVPSEFKTYEAGKQRRYALLFSVNGGAFTIAKLMAGPKPELILGGLSLVHLALGMVAFTLLMSVDIYFFGQHMRSTIPEEKGASRSDYIDMFGRIGKAVLASIAVLLCAGWLLAALGR